MNLDRFRNERESTWSELRALIDRARGKPERLGAGGVFKLGALYREVSADLALARRRWPADPLTSRLEDLVATGRVLVYESEGRRGTLMSFFARDYWVRIRERPEMLIAAATFLLLPVLLGLLWGLGRPDQALGFIPEGYKSVVEPRPPGDLGLSAGQQAAFSSGILTNNIQVTFLAFATGIAAGLGTCLLLIYNGIFIGSIAGLSIQAGNGPTFLELVVAHGVIELSCIIVAGAAGLRLGWALVSPGHRPRAQFLMVEGKAAIEIVLGTIPWLILAALVEGFITPAGAGLPFATGTGLAIGTVYWALVVARGNPYPDARSEPSP